MRQIDAAFIATCVANFPENRVFWNRAQQGVYVLPHCQRCGKGYAFPRVFCPQCNSEATEWQDSPGFGKVDAYTRLQGEASEQVIACVKLDEGPLILAELMGVGPDLAIGQPVCVRMVEVLPGIRIRKFRPMY